MATAVVSSGATIHRVRVAVSALAAAVLGLLPHVLHHAGPLAGAALLGGIGGSLLFGALGLVLSAPFLLRVHRHCGNWRVPAVLLTTFATGATDTARATPSVRDKEPTCATSSTTPSIC